MVLDDASQSQTGTKKSDGRSRMSTKNSKLLVIDASVLKASGDENAIYPTSKHNRNPSEAVDLVPYPIDWNDIDRFKDLAVRFKRIAEEKGIEISAGADWKLFKDYPHFEIKS